jgi:ankyrin repeat protein
VDFPSFLSLSDNVAAQDADFDFLHFEPSESAAHVDLAKFLVDVEHGADVAAKDEHGSTPSHLASKNRHVELAQFLVDYSAVTTAYATLHTDQSTTI